MGEAMRARERETELAFFSREVSLGGREREGERVGGERDG